MNERPSLPWPLWMIALDIVGTLLLAFGLYGLLGGVGSEAFKGLAIASIIVGVMLMLPFFIAIVRTAIERSRTG